MKIAVYCSANNNIDPDFFQMTKELGRWIGKQGHTLVFGGCDMGLMECVAQAAHEAGGQTIGVIPLIVEHRGRKSDYVDIHIPCDNLDDRKSLMVAQSDINIALPGGIGTLDEVFTVLAASSIGYHQKKVILYNMKGFWNSLLAMIDDLEGRGVIRDGLRQHLLVANTLDNIKEIIQKES